MKVKIKTGPLAGKVGSATVEYYDINHTGRGPDLCYVAVDGQGEEMLSSNFEIIEQPEPEDKAAGVDEAGQPVKGGDLVVWRKTLLVVEWNQVEGAWQLRRVEGHYSYPTIRHLADMRVVGSVAGLDEAAARQEIELVWQEVRL